MDHARGSGLRRFDLVCSATLLTPYLKTGTNLIMRRANQGRSISRRDQMTIVWQIDHSNGNATACSTENGDRYGLPVGDGSGVTLRRVGYVSTIITGCAEDGDPLIGLVKFEQEIDGNYIKYGRHPRPMGLMDGIEKLQRALILGRSVMDANTDNPRNYFHGLNQGI
jgi:hypothetical protein